MEVDSGARLRSLYEPHGGVTGVFSAKVADYVTSRPGYPPQLIQLLATRCPPRRGVIVTDVGSGTGLLTAGLLQAGYDVLAVEPNAAMRAMADEILGPQGSYSSAAGTAESLPVLDRSVDLITVAQAFHWFDVGRTRTEFRRVLRANGLVALIWNDRCFEHPLHVALDRILGAFGGEKWQAVGNHDRHRPVPEFFGKQPEQFSWPNVQVLDERGFVSLLFSRSYMPPRDTSAGQAAIAAAQKLFADFAERGQVAVHYRTVLYLDRPV